MKIKFLVVLLVGLLNTACSVNKLISEANSSFARKEYFMASEKLKLASQKVKDKTQKPALYFNLGESYRQMGDYTKAAIWYRNAIRSGYKDSNVELLYADALRGAGKPDEAKPIYLAELKKDPKNTWAFQWHGIHSQNRGMEKHTGTLPDREPESCQFSRKRFSCADHTREETDHLFTIFA